MTKHPVAYAHENYQHCAHVIVNQLERRENDPIMILVGDCTDNSPTPFHRFKEIMADGHWYWKAVDDDGREVRSGVVHGEEEAPLYEVEEDEEAVLLV
jgi:hypothetical protein